MASYIIALFVGLILNGTDSFAASLVEITLVDKLDEPRGFCLDIVGAQQRATPTRGLQAHTCYSYQGKIAVDQGFSADRISSGVFHMPGFDVCMALAESRPGAPLSLRPCDGSAPQQFLFHDNGTIVLRAEPTLCLTVRAGASSPGGGGRPVHLLRQLTVERCNPDLAKLQEWRIREKAD